MMVNIIRGRYSPLTKYKQGETTTRHRVVVTLDTPGVNRDIIDEMLS